LSIVIFFSAHISQSHYQGNVSVSDYQCLYDASYRFAIFQAQSNNGAYSSNLKNNVKNALAAGIKNIDTYIFPDIHMDAASQVRSTISKMRADGVPSKGMIWLDVENTSLYFSNKSQNVSFLHTVMDTCNANWTGCGNKYCCGIYANWTQWSAIMGSDTSFSKYQLWYPHYDGHTSFSDFQPFGGWTKPNIKQFAGTTDRCGTQIDKNFY
jgi:hypothetical protein